MPGIKRISFIGGGNMAEAIFAGLIKNGTIPASEILVSEIKPERCQYLQQTYSIEVISDTAEAVRRSNCILLAVKPQMVVDVKDDFQANLTPQSMVISILAGQSREKLGNAFGFNDRIVRVMPNLPAQVGMGVSAITFPPELAADERQFVRSVLQSVGEVVEVEEDLQDAVTAVSGSGPGYLFLIAGHWISAAVRQGLDETVARALVTETMAGAAEVLKRSADSPADLVRKVATPGGTTEAGLSALQDHNIGEVLDQMVDRAVRRSKELNQK